MSDFSQSGANEALRKQILSDPAVVLEDPDVIAALLDAEDAERGSNVRDMRDVAMTRLSDRLLQLQSSHETVITAAYDNVATTSQVHRAILTMIEPLEFGEFLDRLDTLVADTLRVRAIRLVMESEDPRPDDALNPVSGALTVLPPGFVEGYLSNGRRTRRQYVVLRNVPSGSVSVYGTAANEIRSEAVVRLDLGPEAADGLLVLGSTDPEHFQHGQATDLLELFARICVRMVRSWMK